MTHIKQMLADSRKEYERRIGYEIDDNSRLNNYVQDRVALANAWAPYTTRLNIGKALSKDHSTIVHYVKEHDVYIKSFPSYPQKYNHAIEVTNKFAQELKIEPMIRFGGSRNLHHELMVIKKTIRNLQGFEKKLELKLGYNEKAS